MVVGYDDSAKILIENKIRRMARKTEAPEYVDIKHLPNNEGVCPFCGDTDLQYEAIQLEGNMSYYPWTCKKCSHKGEEWYDMTFAGHNVEDENGDLIELQESKKVTESKEDYSSADNNNNDDDIDSKIWDLFVQFFREVKLYDDWTEEEIDFSMNNDDINEFLEFIKESLQ